MTQHSNAYITTPHFPIDWDSLSTSSVDHTFAVYHHTKYEADDILTGSPTFDNFPEFDFTMAEDPFDHDENHASFMGLPTSPLSTTSTAPGQESAINMDDLLQYSGNTNLHAAPWNMSMSRSVPTPGETPFLIPGQPRHVAADFMRTATASSVPGTSWAADSAYVSAAHTDTASLVSAPSVMNNPFESTSDFGEHTERPTKRAKKTLRCDVPGHHRTREFTNIHDLERHQRSTHGIMSTHSPSHYFLCVHPQCFGKGKWWDRKDNFRSHIVRRHFKDQNTEENKPDIDELVSRSLIKPTREEVAEYHRNKENAKRTVRAGGSKRSGKQAARAGRRSTSASVSNAGDAYAHKSTVSPEPTYMGRDDFAFGGLGLDDHSHDTVVPTIYIPRSLPDGPSTTLSMEAMSAPRTNTHPYSPIEQNPADPSMGGLGMW